MFTPPRELRSALNLRGGRFPVVSKIRHQQNKMRIADRHWNASNFSGRQFHALFISDDGFAHCDLKLVLGFAVFRFTSTSEHAGLESGTGLNGNSIFILHAQR